LDVTTRSNRKNIFGVKCFLWFLFGGLCFLFCSN